MSNYALVEFQMNHGETSGARVKARKACKNTDSDIGIATFSQYVYYCGEDMIRRTVTYIEKSENDASCEKSPIAM